MKKTAGLLLVSAFAATVFAQQQPDVARIKEQLKRDLDNQIRDDMSGMIDNTLSAALGDLKVDMAGLRASTLGLQTKLQSDRSGGAYDAGTRLLDDHKYDDAILRFNGIIDSKSARADGALYWKAYALNRIGRRDEALATIATLRSSYPQSHWLNDAQALEVEVKQGSGKAVSPADETNEDLKLMAINGLMNADPDRAIPLLENLLKGSSAPRVKDRAMFVLTQSRSPRANQVLTDYAKGAGNPDLQVRAIRYIGMTGTPEAQQQLLNIYQASTDPAVKREILRGLMTSNSKDALFNIAKSEKDPALRLEAIRQLGSLRGVDQLVQLFNLESSTENKVQIVRSLSAAGATDRLLDLTRNHPEVRGEAVRGVVMSRSTSVETLAQLYTSDADPKVKQELINGLHSRGDSKVLVDLARKESDPAMKKYIVQRLSTMNSKEATDYMMELLK